MKGKNTKLDIRLTPELDKWLSGEAERLTISKSGFARMVLEKIRVDSENNFNDDRDSHFTHNTTPKKAAVKGAKKSSADSGARASG